MGHDIDSTDTPLEAGLGFAVAWDKPGGFTGREALLKQKEAGPRKKRLVNVLLESADHDLVGAEPIYWNGDPVGVVEWVLLATRWERPAELPTSSAKRASPRPTSQWVVRNRHRRHAGTCEGLTPAVLRPGTQQAVVLTSSCGVVPSWGESPEHDPFRFCRARVLGCGVRVAASGRLWVTVADRRAVEPGD